MVVTAGCGFEMVCWWVLIGGFDGPGIMDLVGGVWCDGVEVVGGGRRESMSLTIL